MPEIQIRRSADVLGSRSAVVASALLAVAGGALSRAIASVPLALVVAAVLLAPGSVRAQEVHNVAATAGSTFNPNIVNANVGDRVRWVNSNAGFHNVNGTSAEFPDNPVDFYSGDVGLAWEFEFQFDVPGLYAYLCDEHGPSMSGTIVVSDPTGIDEDRPGSFEITAAYPNPFQESTTMGLTVDRGQSVRVAVYDITGREVTLLHDGPVAAGIATPFVWRPAGRASGLYVIRFEGETFRSARVVHLGAGS